MLHKIVVAQLGSRLDYTVPQALARAGYFERLFTDIYLSSVEAKFIKSLMKSQRLRQPLAKALTRHNPAIHRSKITRFPMLGIRYINALRRATGSISEQHLAYMKFGHEFNLSILRRGIPEATHLYAYDHAALELFRATDTTHTKLILEQIYPAIHAEALEQEEEERWADWVSTKHGAFCKSELFNVWREIQLEEWRLADTIIVASQYSKDAISNVLPEISTKIKVIPLTINLDTYIPYQHVRHYCADRPLQVLFVGNLNLRKGVPYLLTAFSKIDPSIARLTVVGSIKIREEKIKYFQDRINFLGPIPHVHMPQIYRDADIFVFPTISDGFGAVMLEAMATGLPVISTDHCADIVEDGVNGFRIPIRCPEAITEKMYKIFRQPELLEHLSAGAISTSQRFTITDYQRKLCKALNVPVNTNN